MNSAGWARRIPGAKSWAWEGCKQDSLDWAGAGRCENWGSLGIGRVQVDQDQEDSPG